MSSSRRSAKEKKLCSYSSNIAPCKRCDLSRIVATCSLWVCRKIVIRRTNKTYFLGKQEPHIVDNVTR